MGRIQLEKYQSLQQARTGLQQTFFFKQDTHSILNGKLTKIGNMYKRILCVISVFLFRPLGGIMKDHGRKSLPFSPHPTLIFSSVCLNTTQFCCLIEYTVRPRTGLKNRRNCKKKNEHRKNPTNGEIRAGTTQVVQKSQANQPLSYFC